VLYRGKLLVSNSGRFTSYRIAAH